MVTGPVRAAAPFYTLPLKGLDPRLTYQINGRESFPGDVLMNAGYPLPVFHGDYQSLQLYLRAL